MNEFEAYLFGFSTKRGTINDSSKRRISVYSSNKHLLEKLREECLKDKKFRPSFKGEVVKSRHHHLSEVWMINFPKYYYCCFLCTKIVFICKFLAKFSHEIT